MNTMNKFDLNKMVLETFNEYLEDSLNEAELSTGGNKFLIKVDVNKNPTKKGIKIQLIPKPGTELNIPDERNRMSERIQLAMNKSLGQYDLQVNIDPDIRQAHPNPSVLGYYIPLENIKNLIVGAIKGDLKSDSGEEISKED